ncbi:glycosyltransferase [Geobacter sp. SVR]|uniref:glycosyltransferase n=1 Tax=Geobacter sp. SVR TaxID=2495594 RepID=UPI00143EFF64|nr:glycosyltransferase [Geobacter sp. SVR]BCS53370.1 glycosyl transferase [Geobacter sp. SVR]GCF85504.1 glycosyl transferase [Geobacter sp. SVR]
MNSFKADLHVHSSHSNKPTYWAMRKFNCPESYTSPQFLYRTAKERGMDFVTITDHNAISGALEIAHLPDTFISSEITAHFPENGCKVHVVVLHISEAQFRMILELRKNIYEMLAYLHAEGITHFLAHPLYAQNEKLTLEIIERSLLLFTTFEVKNGCRARRFNVFTKRLLSSLTEQTIARLADKYDLLPYGALPWSKGIVGGSDDHGGLFIARAHTTAYDTPTVEAFIEAVRNGDSWADGEDGGPLTMAHSLYGIAHSFYRERFGERRRTSTPFVTALLERFFNVGSERSSFIEKFRLFVLKNLPPSRDYSGKSFEEVLDREARLLLNDSAFMAGIRDADSNRKIFAVTSRLANRLIFHYTRRLMDLPLNAGFFEYLNTLGTIGLVHGIISPYYLAFHHQHKGKELIRDIVRALPELNRGEERERIALFTDTLDEINGVAITIKRLIRTARDRGVELTVITVGTETEAIEGVKRFAAVGDFVIPEYPELKLCFPPILDVMDFIEREGFTRIHISTPGTVGLLGLLIARLMDIPAAGTYHTDIPQYVRSLTNDEFLEQVAWSYMTWFYSQMEEVMVPSSGTREQLLARGLSAERLKPLPRWVDTELYSPAMGNPGFWPERGIPSGTRVLLYVGRVSREKGLELLVEAFRELADSGAGVALAIIGDGPYRTEMENALKGYPAVFTGYLDGEELRTGYASADLFVFPSATDTFGNVVLEAQASGLPVVVSDEGGPRELMIDGETGTVFRANSKDDLMRAMRIYAGASRIAAEHGQNARCFTLAKAPDSAVTYGTILNTKNATIAREWPDLAAAA